MLQWRIIAEIYFTNERSWHRCVRCRGGRRLAMETVTHFLSDMQTSKLKCMCVQAAHAHNMQNWLYTYLLWRCSLSCREINKMHQNLFIQLRKTLSHSLHQLHLQATLTLTQCTVALNRGCKDPLLLMVPLYHFQRHSNVN